MFYRISQSGGRVATWQRTAADEVLLHCARIGYNP